MWVVLEAMLVIFAAAGAGIYIKENHPTFYRDWVENNFAKLPWVDRV